MLLKIIVDSYKPNTAQTNRLLALAKGLVENGLKVEVVFVHPGMKSERLTDVPVGMIVRYLWDGHPLKNKYFVRLLGFVDVYKYANRLEKGDNVLIIGVGQFLPILLKRSDIHVFHERSEHPDVVKVLPLFLQKSYLKACSRLTGMFVISTPLKQYFENLGVKKVRIVNMIVDDGRFSTINKEYVKDKYIVYCGKATNNKDGVDELIKSFAIASQRHDDIKLYIVGSAPKGHDDSGNMQLVERLGLQDKIVFLGEKPAQEIPQILKNSIACVLDRPDSLQAQCGFPTKLGEYLLSGNPVVVTKVGDIPLFLEHQQNALLANERDANDFANQICWILEHPDKAIEIGEEGRKVALREFNYLYESKKIVDLIRNN